MNTKLTKAQQRAWELIKSELALPEKERRVIRLAFNEKPGTFALVDRKRIARKTMWALYHAGLIDPTDTWMNRFYFRLTDAGKAETIEPAEYFPGGDAGCFPAAHPRPSNEDEPRFPAGGGNPETLGAEYEHWCDRVNQGFTAAETIDELRRQNAMLHNIVAGLRDSLSRAEQELVRLHHRPAAQR